MDLRQCMHYVLLSCLLAVAWVPTGDARSIHGPAEDSVDPLVALPNPGYGVDEKLHFDLFDYIRRRASHLLPVAEVISHWSGRHGVSPKVMLALIEARTGAVTSAATFAEHRSEPLAGLSARSGFSDQIEDVSARLGVIATTFREATPGTAESSGLRADFEDAYGRLFDGITPAWPRFPKPGVPSVSTQPPADYLQLPYPIGEAWTSGPAHANDGANARPYNALDFYHGNSHHWGDPTDNAHVVASHGGTLVVYSRCFFEIIGPSRNWSTTYYHVDNIHVPDGTIVARDTRISNYASRQDVALCGGGFSDGPHLHFALWWIDSHGLNRPVDIDGLSISGYRYHSLASVSYDENCDLNWFEKNGVRYCHHINGNLLNDAAPPESPVEIPPPEAFLLPLLEILLGPD